MGLEHISSDAPRPNAAAEGRADRPNPFAELAAQLVPPITFREVNTLFKQLKKPLLLITFAILLYFGVTNFQTLLGAIVWAFSLFGPFWIGLLLAFALNRPYNFFRYRAFRNLGRLKGKNTASLQKCLALLAVYLLFFAFITILIFMVIPQLAESVQKLSNNFSSYAKSLETVLNGWLDSFGIRSQVWESIDKMWQNFVAEMGLLLTNSVVPTLWSTLSSVATGISNFFIGVVSSVYFLAGKEKLLLQFKRLIRAVFPVRTYPLMNRIYRLSNQMFSEFITGQIANAAVVGVLCFVGMSILRMDYALLISVLVGVANVVPFFGCVIGAVPSAFLLLMVDPMQALWFVIFITVIQALDGNIISPKIVGQSIGLSGLWVMVSIIVGGSMFGIGGMFLGVPVFAVIYSLLRDFTEYREQKHRKDASEDAGPDLPETEKDVSGSGRQ